jgi:hypothetical protein
MIRLVVVIIGLLAIHDLTHAQSDFRQTYGLGSGLPYSEVPFVFHSPDGRIWCNSNTYDILSNYDGIRWQHTDVRKLIGKSSAINYLAYVDNTVWLQSEQHLISVKNDQWTVYALPSARILSFSKNDKIYILDPHLTELELDIKGKKFNKIKQWQLPDGTKNHHKFGIVYGMDNLSGEMVISRYDPDLKNIQYYTYSGDGKMIDDIFVPKGYEFYIKLNERLILFKSNETIGQKRVYQYHNGKIEELTFTSPEGSILQFITSGYYQDLNVNRRALILEDPNTKGRYLYGIDPDGHPYIILSKIDRSGAINFTKDRNGHVWYGSDNGVLRQNPHIIVLDPSHQNMVNSLHSIAKDGDANIWLGGYNNNGWCYYDGSQIKKPLDPHLINNNTLPGAFSHKDGTIFFFADGPEIETISKNKYKTYSLPRPLIGYFYSQLRDGTMVAGLSNHEGILLFDYKNGIISNIRQKGKEKGLNLLNVLTIVEDKAGKLWMGRGSQGIAAYDRKRDTIVTWLRSDEAKTFGASSALVDDYGDLWLGGHNGLRRCISPDRLDILKQNLFDHALHFNLPGNDRSGAGSLTQTKKYIISATDLGIHLIDKQSLKSSKRPLIFSLWYGFDLPATETEQNTMLITQNDLWVGTQMGAIKIDLEKIAFDTSDVNICVEKIRVGNHKMKPSSSSIVLPVNQRNACIKWKANGNPLLQSNIFYDVFVVNNNKDTVLSSIQNRVDSLQFAYLSPDTYQIHIYGYKNNQLKGQTSLTIVVPKLWTESILFWMSLATLLLTIPGFYVYYRNRNKRLIAEKELLNIKSKKEIDRHKVESLSAYFNPHFINNSLHWIQSRYRKDPDTVTIIGRLAENIHRIYNNAEKNNIVHPLREELAIVENYLKISKVRFGEKFTYQLPSLKDPHDALDLYKVPCMMLQLYTENAVEKGAGNNAVSGTVNIEISCDNNGLTINIADNGPGRSVIDEEIIPERRSSTRVMKELIQIYNQHNMYKMKITYIDHWLNADDNFDRKHGTIVRIFIPKSFNYDI